MKLRPLAFRASALVACCLVSHGAVIFNFTYMDVVNDTNLGFDDPTFGATRRATVESVASYLNTVLVENGSVDLRWNLSLNDSGSSTLGSMGSFYFLNRGVDNGMVFKHITGGIDPYGADVDGSGQINFGLNWNSGLGAPAAGQNDLFSVVLHGPVHSLGFNSLIGANGTFPVAGTRSVYDSYLVGPHGNLIDGTGAFNGSSSDLTSLSVSFNGPNAMAANGGSAVSIYSPASYASGASLSHLDTSVVGVMNPFLTTGMAERSLAGVEVAMLKDIGYTVVPEPYEYGLATGLGLLAFASWRRWRSSVEVQP